MSYLHKSADGQAIYQNEVYTDIDGERSGEHIINVIVIVIVLNVFIFKQLLI